MLPDWNPLLQKLMVLRDELAPTASVGPAAGVDPRIRQIDHALRRIARGLYPMCEVCGQRIDMRRLSEQPERTVCDACEAARLRHAT